MLELGDGGRCACPPGRSTRDKSEDQSRWVAVFDKAVLFPAGLPPSIHERAGRQIARRRRRCFGGAAMSRVDNGLPARTQDRPGSTAPPSANRKLSSEILEQWSSSGDRIGQRVRAANGLVSCREVAFACPGPPMSAFGASVVSANRLARVLRARYGCRHRIGGGIWVPSERTATC